MTTTDLIRILREYERAYGERYIVLADDEEIIDECRSVGIDPQTGDIVLSIQD